jgi:beta-galactosidase
MNFEGLSFPGRVEGHPDLLYNTSDAYLDIQSLTLEPEFEKEIRDANAPVGLMLEFFQQHIGPGTVMPLHLLVINDLYRDVKAVLTLQLRTESGVIVWESSRPVSVPSLGKLDEVFDSTFPQQRGAYQLTATLTCGDTAVQSRRDFEIR